MLREIEIVNFLSYKKETVSFKPNSTIAVVGENGHGKSGLLEAILFALYGEGREDLSKLIRIGCNADMKVKLTLDGVPAKAKSLVVERGVKKTGTGFTKVYLNDTLIAQGGAKPSNNKAQEYIDSALGVDKESFLLTSFFGLGANDSLMQVAPSTRLETLQKLAGVDICAAFNKRATECAKELSIVIDKDSAVMNAVKEGNDDITSLKEELKSKIKESKGNTEKLDALQIRRSELSKVEVKYQNLIRELDTVRAHREHTMVAKEKATKAHAKAQESLKTYIAEATALYKRKKETEASLENTESKDSLQEKLSLLIAEKAKAEASIAIYSSAGAVESTGKCPLCGQDITEDCSSTWEKNIEKLNDRIDEIRKESVELKSTIEAVAGLTRKLAKINDDMKGNLEDKEEAQDILNDTTKELEKSTADLNKYESRMKAIRTSLKEFDSLVQTIADVDKSIMEYTRKQGIYAQSISDLKKKIEKCSENNSKVDSLVKSIEQNTKKMLAYRQVADAFSRYAIPVQLLRNLRTALERRATIIYQYFTSGIIKIDDIEGSRPGVEFVLYDENGARSYKALSTGEKVMVFLAIRVALTQIINATKNNKVDFLVLDEVTGNLSPTKRASLTKLINSLLRKFFTQVFMVSHVELRDIFNESIYVEKKNGISTAVVSK